MFNAEEHHRIVGMVIPDGTNQFFSTIAQLIQRELSQRNFGLLLLNSDGSKARELNNLKQLFDMPIDGMIFVSVGDSTDSFELISNNSELAVLAVNDETP